MTEEGSALRGRLLGRGRIDVEAVTFGYPGGGQPVLDRLSFTAAPGRLLAVTGSSGSGKSTVARLLLRFRDPDAGRILLDGDRPARAVPAHPALQRHPAAQEALLFAGTVADNIRYGRSGASAGEVTAAARAFLRDAPVLVLDEPTAGLAAASAQRPAPVHGDPPVRGQPHGHPHHP